MKMLYLGVLKNDVKPVPPSKAAAAPELCAVKYLEGYGFFAKKALDTGLTFAASEVLAPRTVPGATKSVFDEERDVMLHVHSHSTGICAISITDSEYPDRVAQALCRKVVDEFNTKYPRTAYQGAKVGGPQMSFPELKAYIEKYQDPYEADNIEKIKKELDETTKIMRDTIESVLERDEKINDLVNKSENLSAQSKMFYGQAKKQNSCCLVM